MNNTYFGAIHYDIHLDLKLVYTVIRTLQEMSFSKLETPPHLCELERAQIIQSLALAVLKTPYAGYCSSGNRSNFLDYEGKIFWHYTCTKKFHHSVFLKKKYATNAYLSTIKTSTFCRHTITPNLIFGYSCILRI